MQNDLANNNYNFNEKIGIIVQNLNRIENAMNGALSSFFMHANPHSERNFIFNDALANDKIFPTFENKRQFLIQTIRAVNAIAKDHDITFDINKWLKLCKSIQNSQEIRNILAHHYLMLTKNEIVGYYVRKSHHDLIEDKKVGKLGSLKFIEIDLDKEVAKSNQLIKESEELFKFATDALNIFISIGDFSFDFINKESK